MFEPTGRITEVLSNGVLKLRTSTGWHIDIESQLRCTGPDGAERIIAAKQHGAANAVRGLIIGKDIVATRMRESDGLRLKLSGSIELVVAPDPQFEAWHIVGPNAEMIVSMPGGELAIWDAHQDLGRSN